jgi:AP-1 complex subunit mu
VLICRNYRGDVDMSEVEHFMPILMEKEEEGMLSPILAHGGVRFMWIKHNNLYRIPRGQLGLCVRARMCVRRRAGLGHAGPPGDGRGTQ